jgi:hypothetical protein
VDGAEVQPRDQLAQVCRRGRAARLARRGGGVPEAAQVDGEHAVPLAQQRDQLAEDPPGLGEAVDQQYRGPGGSRADVVQFGAVHAGAVVADARNGGVAH